MKYSKPSDIPDEVVERIKTKKTYRRIAEGRARKLGIPLSELPDSEWREIWWKRAERRHKYYRKKVLQDNVPAKQVSTDGLEEEVKRYLEYYADATPNDIVAIRQIVSLSNQLKRIDQLIEDTLSGDDVDTAKYKRLVSIQKQVSTEIRMLQESLGISRRQRDVSGREDISEYIKANIEQARQLLDEFGTKVYCPYCQSSGVDVLQAFVIDHFPETGLTIKKRCPSCGRDYQIDVPSRKWGRQIEVDGRYLPVSNR